MSVPGDYVAEFFGACHGGDLLEWFPESGATWWRNGTNWASQEPEKGAIDHSRLDQIAEDAAEQGVSLLPILGFCAPWASDAPEDATHPNRYPPRADAVDEWRDYVGEMADRYPDVTHWEVWNEPNLDHFFKADLEAYVDRVLIPAARELHDRGRKVVAPSFTLEWPTHSEGHPDRPRSWSVAANARSTDAWLSYNDAWRHVDYLSVHYLKGDTKKREFPHADDLRPWLDHVYENYIAEGKLDGVWNTEEGLTAVETGGDFDAMEPWERPPYAQWLPRYALPMLHWALDHDWEEPDDYKLFWYHMAHGTDDVLEATDLLREGDDGLELTDTGRAMGTLTDEIAGEGRVAARDDATVGFGVTGDRGSYEFPAYAFDVGEDVFVAAFSELPGVELASEDASDIQARVGVEAFDAVELVDYVTGERSAPNRAELVDGALEVDVPRTDDPVVYLRVS